MKAVVTAETGDSVINRLPPIVGGSWPCLDSLGA